MSQEQKKPVNLSVHEISDPSEIVPNIDGQPANEAQDYSRENVDASKPALADTDDEKLNSQTITANLSAG